mmetsp:Transcript_45756/g.91280  ORF Transcript_45756/g.91280 Transcript_45756/m.91280 type:complete len:228 (+) Transcript_45756:86-769(+)
MAGGARRRLGRRAGCALLGRCCWPVGTCCARGGARPPPCQCSVNCLPRGLAATGRRPRAGHVRPAAMGPQPASNVRVARAARARRPRVVLVVPRPTVGRWPGERLRHKGGLPVRAGRGALPRADIGLLAGLRICPRLRRSVDMVGLTIHPLPIFRREAHRSARHCWTAFTILGVRDRLDEVCLSAARGQGRARQGRKRPAIWHSALPPPRRIMPQGPPRMRKAAPRG